MDPPNLKILMVGDSRVGKTALMLRFSDNTFTETYMSTQQVDVKIRKIEIEGETTKLEIWDPPGQGRFRTITSSYYAGVQGIILVYDVTDQLSFNFVKQWLLEIERYAASDVKILLVGNKCDLRVEKVILQEKSEEFAMGASLMFMEASAKEGTNVEKAFLHLATEIMKDKKKSGTMDLHGGALVTPTAAPPEPEPEPEVEEPEPAQSAGCCIIV